MVGIYCQARVQVQGFKDGFKDKDKLSMMRHQRNDMYLWGFGFVSVLNMMSTSEEYFKRGN